MIKAVLWDWDGVISAMNLEEAFSSSLDMPISEKEKMRIFWRNFLKFGVRCPDEYPYCEKFYSMIEKESRYKVNSDFHERLKKYVKERRGIIRPEIPEILEELNSKHTLAILTSADGRDEKVELAKKHDILKYFDYVFPLKGSSFLKPESRIYQQAEDKLKVKSKEIFYIDDNITRGIRPAKSRGWTTCFFAPFSYLSFEKIPLELKPDYTVKKVNQIKKIFS